MLEQGGPRNTKGNLALWVAVVLLSVLGLGANVYKANTGEELSWAVVVSELAILLAAGYFIYNYFRSKRKEQDK